MVWGSGAILTGFLVGWTYVAWSFWWAGSHGVAGPVGLPLLVLAVAVGWRMRRPAGFSRWVVRPVVARLRAVVVYGPAWEVGMIAARVATAPRTGDQALPVLVRVRRSCIGDVVTARMLPGQTLAQWSACADRLAQAFNATSCRVAGVAGRPRLVTLTFATGEPLARVVPPIEPPELDVLDLEAVPVARTEDGGAYCLPVLYAHTLVAGETGSGKGSVLWSILAGLGPAIRTGLVQVWAIDPKGGMELGAGAPLFVRFAYGAPANSEDGKAAPAW